MLIQSVILLSLMFGNIITSHVSVDDESEDEKEAECVVGEWTTWSPCRSPRTFRHLYVDEQQLNDNDKNIEEDGPSPPAPPSGTRRRKRDLTHHITKRHTLSEPSRRSKRQAETSSVQQMTAHQMMQLIEKNKLKDWLHRQTCRKEKTCPELNPRKTCGPEKCINGTAGPFPCNNIDMLSLLSIEDLGYGKPMDNDKRVMANDVWGWTDTLYGDEYVIIGLSGGTSFVRITDPYKPQVLGFLYTKSVPSTWRDIKVVNNTAYIVSEAPDHGMQVFDLTRLRNKTTNNVLYADADYSEFGSAHNIVSNDDTNYVYAVGARGWTWNLDTPVIGDKIPNEYGEKACEGGLHIIDVIDPLNPKFVGCFDEDGYTHDAQCVVYNGPDERYLQKEICFAFNEDTLTIVDLTEHGRPKLISRTEYRGSQYTHQGWLTEDHRSLVLDDELDEMENIYDQHTKTHIWDVSNLEKPMFKSTYESPVISIDHNQYVVGNYTWQSNYVSGLQVLYIDQDNYDLKPVAYFDVLPSGDGIKFEGTWSNYPFFKSGVIAVSSMEYGLFLLKPDYEAMRVEAMDNEGLRNPKLGYQWRMRSVMEAEDGAECPASEARRSCHIMQVDETGVYID